MPVSKTRGPQQVGRYPSYAPYPENDRAIQRSREVYRSRSVVSASASERRSTRHDGFSGDRYVPSELPSRYFGTIDSYRPVSGKSHVAELEHVEQDESSADVELLRCSSPLSESSRSTRSCSSFDEIEDYLELLYGNIGAQDRLSAALMLPDVIADHHRRRYHWGGRCARQYDLTLPHVFDMLRYMYERFDTVSCYSMGLLEEGMIVYYLEPYTLGLDQADQGWGTVTVGGPRFEARVHLKGRFAVVVNKFIQHVRVAEIFSFGKEGLQSKPAKVWPEYVGLRAVEHKDFYNPSTHKPLEVANSCCEILPQSSVHLVTDKISLSNQILFAGWITHDSLRRLRTMIRKTESR